MWWWVCAIEEEEVNSVVRKVVGAAGVGYVERYYAFRCGWYGGCVGVGASAMSVETGLVDLREGGDNHDGMRVVRVRGGVGVTQCIYSEIGSAASMQAAAKGGVIDCREHAGTYCGLL